MTITRRSIKSTTSPALDGELLPPTPRRSRAVLAVPRIRLSTAADIRRELARLYREARAKRLDPQDATRMAYLLDVLRKAIETDVLRTRIEALEGGSTPAAGDAAPCGSFRYVTGHVHDDDDAEPDAARPED